MDMVAAVNTKKGIVIIDSGMSPSLTARHKSIIEEEFKHSDFKYVINTHHHDDHVNGNQVFKDTEIIAHENAVKRMQENNIKEEITSYVKYTRERNKIRNRLKKTLKKDSGMRKKLSDRIYISGRMCDDYETIFRLTLPTITFTDRLILDMGDLTIELVYFGPGFHSDNDIIVSIPEEKVVFMGDILMSRDQYHRVSSKSNIEHWIHSLDKVYKNNSDIKKVVAYHVGVLAGKALKNFQNSLKARRREQRQKKSAVDSLRAMISESNVQEAVNMFEDKFLRNKNKDFYIWEGDFLSLISEYQEEEKYDEALKMLKMHEKLFPNSTRGLFSQARIFTKQGKNQLAIEAYKKMLSLDPANYYYVEMIYRLENSN
jgi:glyoxylase-like metal-dependent hydrolase (beta-lactamase superfamily II)